MFIPFHALSLAFLCMFPFSVLNLVSLLKFVGVGVGFEPGSDITTLISLNQGTFRNLSHLLLRDGAGVCVVHWCDQKEHFYCSGVGMFNSREMFGFPVWSWINFPDLSYSLQYKRADPAWTVAFGCGEICSVQWLVLLWYVAKQNKTMILLGRKCWCFLLTFRHGFLNIFLKMPYTSRPQCCKALYPQGCPTG